MFRGAETRSARRFDAPALFAFPDVEPGLFDSDDDGDEEEDEDNEGDDSSESSPADLFDSREFYTLEQDLLLVKHRCFQPELKMNDVSQRFEREFGVTRTVSELEQRFQTLQAPEFSVLFALYLQAISLNKDKGAAVEAGTFVILPEYQSQLRATRTSCETKLFQLLYEDEKFRNESSETISIEITGRNFPKVRRELARWRLGCVRATNHGFICDELSL